MLKGKTIICFGSSTWTYPGLQQTVMRKLSKHNKIIFVNSIGTRKISLKLDQLPFYVKRIRRILAKNKEENSNVVVCDPWVIPVMYSRIFNVLNRFLLSIQLKKLISNNEISQYILWIGTPVVEPFIDIFNPEMTIYNPVDRFSAFEFVDAKKIKSREESIASKCDLIIGTSDAIRDDLLPFNQNTFSVSHGVDIEHFQQDLSAMAIPEDIAHIQKPIIGFFGGLSERLDYDLILATANKYRNFSVVLIGSKLINLDILKGMDNLHLLGAKDFSELPMYLNQFDVCLIPYKVNELTLAVDPVKLREYLSAGKPVVSVDLPEVRKLKDVVYIGKDISDFLLKVGQAVYEDSPKKQNARIQTAEFSDWKYKMQEIEDIVTSTLRAKQQCSHVPESVNEQELFPSCSSCRWSVDSNSVSQENR